MKPVRAGRLVDDLRTGYRTSIRRPRGMVCFDRSTYHYRHRQPEQGQSSQALPRTVRSSRQMWLPPHLCFAAAGTSVRLEFLFPSLEESSDGLRLRSVGEVVRVETGSQGTGFAAVSEFTRFER